MLADLSGFQFPYPLQNCRASSMDTLQVEITLRNRLRVLIAQKFIAEPGQNSRETLDVLRRSQVNINWSCQTVTQKTFDQDLRRNFIGASDARTIMGIDEAALVQDLSG